MRTRISWLLRTVAVAALLLTGAAPASAASADPGPAIVGGHDATQPYPAMASVQFDRGAGVFGHTCGASLITYRGRTAAVTGAHCVTADDASPLPASLFKVRVGSALHASGGTLIAVRKVLPHPAWDWATGDDPVADIAVLLLATPPGQPGLTITADKADDAVRLLGWGSTKPSGEGPLPDVLQELDTQLVDPAGCAEAGITAGEVCVAGGGGAGACFGDSGGPALHRTGTTWTVLGGASRETAPTCGTNPVVYTDWRTYRGFIAQAISTGCVPPRTHRPAPRGQHRDRWSTTA